MINNENKLWKKSLILTIISFVFQILYTGIGIESFILIYVPQENLQALALLILLPLLIFICIIILTLSIISLIASTKCLKKDYKKKTSILFLSVNIFFIVYVLLFIGSLFIKNLL